MVHFGSVPIDSGSTLRAQVPVAGVEIECADAVFAPRALEPYSAFYSVGGVVGHALIVVLCSEERMHHGGLSKVTNSQIEMVGTGRFELPTPRTPSECSTRLSHVPTGKDSAERSRYDTGDNLCGRGRSILLQIPPVRPYPHVHL